MFDDRFPDWKLVHGEVLSPIGDGSIMSHAWLRKRNMVYDPVLNRSFFWTVYKLQYEAQVTASFSQKEAAKAAYRHGHLGPW